MLKVGMYVATLECKGRTRGFIGVERKGWDRATLYYKCFIYKGFTLEKET